MEGRQVFIDLPTRRNSGKTWAEESRLDTFANRDESSVIDDRIPRIFSRVGTCGEFFVSSGVGREKEKRVRTCRYGFLVELGPALDRDGFGAKSDGVQFA